jgi:hypothetical protein
MHKNQKILFFLFLFAISFYACKKDETTNEDVYLGYNYFPQQPGDSIIYDVHLRFKDALNPTPVDSSYQLLERVESIFNDNQNRPTLRLERYVRTTSTDPWIIYKVWTANLTNENAEKREDNIPYVKLVFPIKENQTWNGNILNPNSTSAQDYSYSSIHQSATINGLAFDSIVTVLQREEQIFNSGAFDFEQFATNVGLVNKQKFNYQIGATDTTELYLYTEKVIYHN